MKSGMANINPTIEQLTASLQELTVQTYNSGQPMSAQIRVDELQVSKDVAKFVEDARDYAEKTRDVSTGTY